MSLWRSTRRQFGGQRTITRTITQMLWAPLGALIAVWKRLTKNWRYGKVRNLLLGLPAVFALIACLWMSALVRANPSALQASYLEFALSAIDTQDYETAEVYLQRVIDDFRTSNPKAEFALAEVFENTNRASRADLIYQRLAPDDRRGYAPAHSKRAAVLSATLSNPPSPEELRTLRWHLDRADEESSPQLSQAWSRYHLALGQVDLAIERLEEAVDEVPQLNLFLGELYARQQNFEQAQVCFENAAAFLRAALDTDAYDVGVRLFLANTLLILGEFQECEEVLLVGLQQDPEGPYKQLLAVVYTRLHDVARQQEGVKLSELFRLLRVALEYDPNCSLAYERLMGYASTAIEGQDIGDGDESLYEILNDAIAQGEEPGLAHFARSMLKWNEEDFDACRFDLERAHHFLPNMPFVANNLAFLLATEEPVDLPRALELIQSALDTFPTDPRLLDTRATILMKLNRWSEAYDDLALALQNVPPQGVAQVALHKQLANVCDELNQPDLADDHRRLATEIEAAVEAAASDSAAAEGSGLPLEEALPELPPLPDSDSPDSSN